VRILTGTGWRPNVTYSPSSYSFWACFPLHVFNGCAQYLRHAVRNLFLILRQKSVLFPSPHSPFFRTNFFLKKEQSSGGWIGTRFSFTYRIRYLIATPHMKEKREKSSTDVGGLDPDLRKTTQQQNSGSACVISEWVLVWPEAVLCTSHPGSTVHFGNAWLTLEWCWCSMPWCIWRAKQLTVITISDHHTRVSTGGGAQEAGGRVIGLLFGSQNGLDVSIYDAMEVACTAVGADGLELNEALVEKQKDLCELPPSYRGHAWCRLALACAASFGASSAMGPGNLLCSKPWFSHPVKAVSPCRAKLDVLATKSGPLVSIPLRRVSRMLGFPSAGNKTVSRAMHDFWTNPWSLFLVHFGSEQHHIFPSRPRKQKKKTKTAVSSAILNVSANSCWQLAASRTFPNIASQRHFRLFPLLAKSLSRHCGISHVRDFGMVHRRDSRHGVGFGHSTPGQTSSVNRALTKVCSQVVSKSAARILNAWYLCSHKCVVVRFFPLGGGNFGWARLNWVCAAGG